MPLVLAACEPIQDRCGADADCGTGARCQTLSGARLCVVNPDSYRLTLELPDPVGRAVDFTLRESASPGASADRPATVSATLEGTTVPVALTRDGPGSWKGHLDLPPGDRDEALLELHAQLQDDPSVHVDTSRAADQAGPRIDAPQPERAAHLDARVQVEIALQEKHGGVLQAVSTAPGQDPPDASTWPTLTLESGHVTFTIQATDLGPLLGIDGSAHLHLLARDDLGNETLTVVGLPITRKVLDAPITLPGVASGAPAILADGRVLLAFDSDPGLLVVDPTTLQQEAVPLLGPDGVALTPAVGQDGVYVPKGKILFILDPATLKPKGSCPQTIAAGSGPALGRSGTTEVALAGLLDGSFASFRLGSGGPGCTGASGISGAASAGWPAVVNGASVLHGLVPGIGGTGTLVSMDVDEAGTFNIRGGGGSLGSPEVTTPLAIDGTQVIAVSGDTAFRFTFNTTFTGVAQTEQVSLGSSATGSPAIGQDDVLVPTATGLAVLPRTGSWTEPKVLSLGPSVVSPVIGADGTVWLATEDGTLHALTVQNHEAHELWSDALGMGVRVTPTLTCNGQLWILGATSPSTLQILQVDSKGLDPAAPWPRLQHDAANTGNPATSNNCP